MFKLPIVSACTALAASSQVHCAGDTNCTHRMGQRARHCADVNQPGKPNQNVFVELFNRSFRDEVLNANLFNSVVQAQEAAHDLVHDYNEFRPHESLGEAPMEFMPRKFVKEISSFQLST